MYTKVYRITSNPDARDALLQHYDSVITPAIKQSPHHVGHDMVEIGSGELILSSHYKSAEAAEAAVPMVQELVAPMAEQFGMKLDVIGQGELIREFSAQS